MYDPTTGYVETPHGTGKFVSFDPNTGMVTVEIDGECLVEFDGTECFIKE